MVACMDESNMFLRFCIHNLACPQSSVYAINEKIAQYYVIKATILIHSAISCTSTCMPKYNHAWAHALKERYMNKANAYNVCTLKIVDLYYSNGFSNDHLEM